MTKRKSVRKAASLTPMRSFKISRSHQPFMTFQITPQTFYWIAICLFVLALGIWVTLSSVRVQDIYTQVDQLVWTQFYSHNF